MPERPPLVDLDPAHALAAPSGVETHISVLLFAGSRAFKLCKPVDFGFVDYRTPDRRSDAMRHELVVNRRFAPDVYLGTLDLTDPDGTVVDTALVMRWLPADRRLSLVLSDAQRADTALREVARQVASIHAASPRSPEIDRAGSPEIVWKNWRDNLDTIAAAEDRIPIDPDDVERIGSLAAEYLAGRGELFARRIADGHIVDGHGDLLADDIFCLDDGPRILDALAFSDDLRCGDVLLDAAFLAMDVERRAGAALADRFLEWYGEFSAEHHPVSLAHFYVAYRASVRAKVAGLRAGQGDGLAAEHAVRDLRQCIDHLERARVRMVLVGGPPGTGKSTLAGRLGDRLGWTVLSTDEIRREAGEPADSGPDGFGAGRYRPSAIGSVYDEIRRRAALLAANGESVVLDASWSSARERATLRMLAAEQHAVLVELRCDIEPAVADERIRHRAAAGWSASDATPTIAHEMRARFAPWPEAVVIDTTSGSAATCDAALGVLDRIGRSGRSHRLDPSGSASADPGP